MNFKKGTIIRTNIEEFAEIKENMIIAKGQENVTDFKKYYKLVVEGYKELTGEDFEKKMEEIEKNK